MRLILWLFVLNLGVAFGAGLYEARIAVPQWITSSPEAGFGWNPEIARTHDTGRRFWVFVTTIPLTLLTMASLVLALRSQGMLRRWWLAAALAAMLDRVVTFSYFIPTMVRLLGSPDSAEARAQASMWADLNHVRHVILLTAWLCAMKAFAAAYQRKEP